jgi:ribosomal protein S18 acetylase RimI-like enzyme
VATIRPYRDTDLDALYEICLLTGDSGQDATPLYRDPKILGHVYAGPYAALEPELAFVAEDEQGVGGYVLGALDTADFERRQEEAWWPALRRRYPDPGAATDLSPDQRMAWVIHHPHPFDEEINARYPSHLHIDLLPRLQRGGNGRRLMRDLLDALAVRGSRGVHLGVGINNRNAVGFYRHLGFEEIRAREWGYIFAMALGQCPASEVR